MVVFIFSSIFARCTVYFALIINTVRGSARGANPRISLEVRLLDAPVVKLLPCSLGTYPFLTAVLNYWPMLQEFPITHGFYFRSHRCFG